MNTETILEEGYIVRNCRITRTNIFLDSCNLCYQLELSGADFNATVGINTMGSIKFSYDDGSAHSVYLSSGVCGATIMKVMHICGVASWEAVLGSCIRVAIKDSKVVMLGHIILEDLWMNNDLMANSTTDYKEFT